MPKYTNDITKWYTTLVARIDDAMLDTAEEVAADGQDVIYQIIDSSGTGRKWKRTYYSHGTPRSGSFNGRNWTGQMRADVEQRAKRINRNTAVAEFGWVDHYEDYYGLQDVGFTQKDTGIEIEGMHALADAADLMKKRAEDLIGSKLRAI